MGQVQLQDAYMAVDWLDFSAEDASPESDVQFKPVEVSGYRRALRDVKRLLRDMMAEKA